MLFRPDANAERMSQGAQRLAMVPPPKELFIEAVKKVGARMGARIARLLCCGPVGQPRRRGVVLLLLGRPSDHSKTQARQGAAQPPAPPRRRPLHRPTLHPAPLRSHPCQTVEANAAWVPPHGKGSLYLRPLLMGSGPILGLGPAPSYTLVR